MIIRILHWSIVVSVMMAYSTAYYRYWYTTQTEVANWTLLVIHINVGLLIFILSIVMFTLYYRLSTSKDSAAPVITTTTKTTPARIMHYALYFMLISLPISAYLGTGFDIPVLGAFNLPGFFRFEYIEQTVLQKFDMLMITLIEPFANYHRDIASDILLPLLLIGHIGAAIIHYKLKKIRPCC
ncbi:cytochrome b [Colwellia psychrerythraea]|uniref:cytochrome b n=1 Tax=Colwellia psychrerythraea TaxID=28229 RepID=UPI0002E8BAD0|nr:cytochrome b/b6 domain-containing protein [Colwellia psychrerythraea]